MCENEEDCSFDYSEASTTEPDANLENQYYLAKELKYDEPITALQLLQNILDLQNDAKSQWGFKAIKQMIKTNFYLENYDQMITQYKEFFTYINKAVTRNHFVKACNSLLNYVSLSKNTELMECFYEITLAGIQSINNDGLWLKTTIKLGKIYFEKQDFEKLKRILEPFNQYRQTYYGENAVKGAQLLELYALQIQMYTELQNQNKLRTLYEGTLGVESTLCQPLVMGVIHECGGKLYLWQGDLLSSSTIFREAFKCYENSRSPRRTLCLKYIEFIQMLIYRVPTPAANEDEEMLIDMNAPQPFNNFREVDVILNNENTMFIADSFIEGYVESMVQDIRIETLVKLTSFFKNTKISFENLAITLNIPPNEVEHIIFLCFEQRKLNGTVNLFDRTVTIN